MKFDVLAFLAFYSLSLKEAVEAAKTMAPLVKQAVIVCSEASVEDGYGVLIALEELAKALPFKTEIIACRAIVVTF